MINVIQKKTIELEQILTQAKSEELNLILEKLPNISFVGYINQLMIEKNLQKADVVKDSLLPRTYAYQIFQGTKQAGRDKILLLALAMRCNLEQTNRLLTLASHNRLYAKHQRDAILIFCIQNKMKIADVDTYLNEYQLPLLVNYD